MRRFLFIAILVVPAWLLAPLARCQSDSMIHVNQFRGTTVADKVTNAMGHCPAAPIPCYLVIDASLAAAASGTMPTLCSNCSLADYRYGIPSGPVADKGGQVVNVKAYGAKGDGLTDDTAAISSAISASGSSGAYVYFPAGTYITDTQTFSVANIRVEGAGIDRTFIKSKLGNTIFTASSAIDSALFKNFTLLPNGGSGYGIYLPASLSWAYSVIVDTVKALGFPAQAIYMPQAFSTRIVDSQASSTGNNAFDIHGGPSCLFQNDYAIDSGNGYAGYRVHSGGCTFVSANGIDGTNPGESWGIFGDTVAQDGDLAYAFPVIIGSNIESFTEYGVWLKSGSGATIIGTGFGNNSSHATAPVMAIRADTADALVSLDATTSITQSSPNSQTWANGQPIHGIAGCRILLTGYNPGGNLAQVDTCYNDNNTLVVTIPALESTNFSFGIAGLGVPFLESLNSAKLDGTIYSASTVPTVTGCGTISSQVGGALAGTFVTSGTSCTAILSGLPSSPNGYTCLLWDQTHATAPVGNLSSTSTSATFGTITTTASDKLAFQCGVSY